MKFNSIRRLSIYESGNSEEQTIKPEVVKLANEVVDMKNGKPDSIKKFSNTMVNEYGIKDERSFMQKMKSYLIIGGAGVVGISAVGGIGYLIYKGITLAAKSAWSLASKGGIYGQIALICVIVVPIIYKILKSIFKKKKVSESIISYNNNIEYKKIELRKVILESSLMISKMNAAIESKYFNESDAQNISTNMMNKSEGICSKILGWITKGIKNTVDFIKKHPYVTCVILIIIGFTIACIKNPYQMDMIKNVFTKKDTISGALNKNKIRDKYIEYLKDYFEKYPNAKPSRDMVKQSKEFYINLEKLIASVKK